METLTCGHEPTKTDGLGTGRASGRLPDGRTGTMCYPCATLSTNQDINDATIGDKTTLYLNEDGKSITTWTGDVIMPRVYKGDRHPWSRDRFYVQAVDRLGRIWSGTAGEGMWASLKLTKQTA